MDFRNLFVVGAEEILQFMDALVSLVQKLTTPTMTTSKAVASLSLPNRPRPAKRHQIMPHTPNATNEARMPVKKIAGRISTAWIISAARYGP